MTCPTCSTENAGRFCYQCGTALTALPAVRERTIDHPPIVSSVRDLTSTVRDIGQGNVTNRAQYIQNLTDESMVWEDSPSLALMAGPLIRTLLLIVFLCWLAVEAQAQGAWMIASAITLIAIVRLVIRLASLCCTRYSMTSQRLIIESGVFSRVSVPYEVHQLGESIVSSSLFLRICGRANLTIIQPRLHLRAIGNAQGIRDLLRTAGQREAERIEKIRWR